MFEGFVLISQHGQYANNQQNYRHQRTVCQLIPVSSSVSYRVLRPHTSFLTTSRNTCIRGMYLLRRLPTEAGGGETARGFGRMVSGIGGNGG